MQVFDNINKTVKDDLTVTVETGSKLAIATACFSISNVTSENIGGFRDSSFTSDATRVNFEQIFKTYSPTTIRKVL